MSRKTVRRRRPGPAARIRPFWFLIGFLVVLVAFGSYWLATWPALDPHAIEVSGNRIVSKETIIAAAHVDLDRNMWLQNTSAMERRIAAIPYVDAAAVRRLPPGTLRISVTERIPFAVVQTAGSRVLVDRTMRVLQNVEGPSALPVVVAPKVRSVAPGALLSEPSAVGLVSDLERLQAAHIDVVQLSHDRFGDVDGVLRDGVRVLFGDEADFDKAMVLVNPILEQVGRNRRPIAAIDLRALRTPVVVYKK